jgi:ATP-binding cassette subfamily B protein
MRNLASLNKYFIKYKWRFLLGLLFVTVSNLFAVVSPVIVRNVLDHVQENVTTYHLLSDTTLAGDMRSYIFTLVLWNGVLLLGLALARGVFMFFMRQTIIVMSRHIEYDQKNEVYKHYQQLDTQFYKTHFTGDLMNRISEDVSRVRMYTGPSLMYSVNLVVLTIMCIWGMLRVNAMLTLYVVAPLPLLALCIYIVNSIIFRKSEKIQAQLSQLTTTAQESYSGIRVIKSFVQENNMLRFFNNTSDEYKKSAVNLSLTEAIYFPSMNTFIGLSMLSTILIGGYLAIQGKITPGNIAEYVIYINLLMFPISSIGWVASMVQRAGASQKRIDEFLNTKPTITDTDNAVVHNFMGDVSFKDVDFTYQHTGIQALKHFSLDIKQGEKVAIIGRTGSGKSTLAHMLLRMFDTDKGQILFDGISSKSIILDSLRSHIAYAPQEAYLFSDTVYNNIKFGKADATEAEVKEAAHLAALEKDIAGLAHGYETMIGERGVMLSGGQKQRMVLARALLKNSSILLMDESLSAVDTQTEQTILANLSVRLKETTTIVITHRIFTSWKFDKIVVLEQGTHEELMDLNGQYAALYRHQIETSDAIA